MTQYANISNINNNGASSIQNKDDDCSKDVPIQTATLDDVSPAQHSCEILLDNFTIKDKPHRLLLNCSHLVWGHFNINQTSSFLPQADYGNSCLGSNNQQNDNTFAKHQQTHETTGCYDSNSTILPLTDIIRVSRGLSKSDSLRNAYLMPQSLPENNTVSTCQYLTIHYAKRLMNSPNDCHRYKVQHVTLHNPDAYIITKWQRQLDEFIIRNTSRMTLKRLLVFINPYGGQKKALKVYKNFCKPIMQLAGIDDYCIITQRPNQIYDMLMLHDLSSYDAVCCVGGDGTVAEVLNGLIKRAIHDEHLDMKNPEYIPKPSLPVGIIPAGSTNTVAYSLHGTSDVQTATIHLVLGQRKGLDICSVQNNVEGIKRFCASLMAYGYLGDIAAESDKYRWMGTKRYEYAGLKAFFFNRGYRCEMRVLIEDDNEIEPSELIQNSICNATCCENNGLPQSTNYSMLNAPSSDNNYLRCSNKDSTKSKWHLIEGEFFMVIGANMKCACTRSPHGVSRHSQHDDGYLELILIRKTNLLNNIRFLFNSMARNGDIRNLQFVENYRTRQFDFKCSESDNRVENNETNLEASTQRITNSKYSAYHSSWNCDGEVFNDMQLTMKSHRQLVDVFMRGQQPFIASLERGNRYILCCCKA